MCQSHLSLRRESVRAVAQAAERRFGHADADDRASILLEIQEALDDRVLTRAEGCRAAGVLEGTPFDGTLPTATLRQVLAAIRKLPR